jgi:hypothetical protein
MQYYIKDKKWAKVYAYLRKEKGLHIYIEYQVQHFIEAIWYVT